MALLIILLIMVIILLILIPRLVSDAYVDSDYNDQWSITLIESSSIPIVPITPEYSNISYVRDRQKSIIPEVYEYFLDESRYMTKYNSLFADCIIIYESGWNPDAKNPLSSARGLGQFIDGTWNSTE